MEELGKSRRKQAKLKPIARKRFNFLYLLIAFLFGIITAYIIYNFPPTYVFTFERFSISIFPFFVISLSVFIFSLITFMTKKRSQGIIFTLLIIGYLLMRTQGLTHWIFLTLILALFITAELFIFKKK